MRRDNLALVLRALREGGPAPRAALARSTGLNKATVSSLVGELVDRGLVQEGRTLTGAAGRPGQLVEVVPRQARGLGLEINVDYAAAGVADLTGTLLGHRRVPLDVPALGVDAALEVLGELATEVLREVLPGDGTRAGWLVGTTVAVPGLVDVAAGHVRYAPNLGWRDVLLAERLGARLPAGAGAVQVDNDANLSALAEYTAGVAAGTPDLVYLTGEYGVGGGVIADGRLLRGALGYTGEVGHLPLDPMGPYCGCGRRGCWETQVGLGALLARCAGPGDEVRDPSVDLEHRLGVLAQRARSGDARTLDALRQIGIALGVGASALVNVLNPAALVLGGYFAVFAPWIVPAAEQGLAERVLAPDAGGCRIVPSDLGFTAAVRGGAEMALQRVLTDPTLAPAEAAT